MKNFIEKLGVVLLAIGVSSADSDSLIIPTVLVILGCVILLFTDKEGCDE